MAAVDAPVLPSSFLVLRAVADASGVYAYVVDGDHRWLVRRRPDGPVEPLADAPRVEQLALDEDRVVWVGEDGVQSVAKAGGPVESLAPRDWTMLRGVSEPARWGVAVRGEDVFFSLDDGVGRVPRRGGEAELLAEVPAGHGATLAGVDDDEVWWLQSIPGAGGAPGTTDVLATPRSGGASRRVVTGLGGVLALVVGDDGIFWLAETERRAVGALHRASKRTGEAALLATDVPTYYARVLAADGESLFWLEYPSGLHGPMRVRTMPAAGGAPETLAEPFPPAHELALDGGRVYWAGDGVRAVPRPRPASAPSRPVHLAW